MKNSLLSLFKKNQSNILMKKQKLNLFSKIIYGSLLLGSSVVISPERVNASIESDLRTCPESGTIEKMTEALVGRSPSEQPDCYITPEKVSIKFYEMGFCKTDPYDAEYNFDKTKCEKAWSNADGDRANLATFVAEGLFGETVRLKNGTYAYAYMIIDNLWILKGSYTTTLNGGTTYYTNNTDDGTGYVEDATTNSSDYTDLNMTTKYMTGDDNCGFKNFGIGDDGQTVEASITNDDLTLVKGFGTDSNGGYTCGTTQGGTPTRMVGLVGLSSPLTMTDDITSYKMEWKIKGLGLGIEVDHDSGGGCSTKNCQPGWWTPGPVVPIFTLN